MITYIRHCGFVINNPKHLELYIKILGFEIVKEQRLQGEWISKLLGFYNREIDLTYYKLKLQGEPCLLEFYLFHNYDTKPANFNHVALTITKYNGIGLDVLFKKLKESQLCTIISEPSLDPDKGNKLGFIRDLSGNLIELVEKNK